MKVYGPYMDSTKKRRIVIIISDEGTRKTLAYARFLLEQHLGRPLIGDEQADHKDGDSLNDDLSNLQVLSRRENIRKSAKAIDWFEFLCPTCGSKARKEMRNVKANWKKGRSGPYCSRSCAHKGT